MRKILLTLTIISFIMANIYSQSIDKKVIKELQNSFTKSKTDIALQNAISNNSIKDLAVNRQNAGKQDHFFDIEVKTGSITDQKSSGRCWMFTSLNVFRPMAMEKFNLSDFEFSENYLYLTSCQGKM